ncbi:hypothetical protein CEXT_86651 [Caerostris extrusa]|uniref:Mitochondrial inner membrane protease subunit 2 n=1 Tax=Caerostris extrusa TaxID=172846 RepID=A0AAV4N7S0_CAEEX|nr:hypothetical protein CEXT_86651 [Caerostris extrusa]
MTAERQTKPSSVPSVRKKLTNDELMEKDDAWLASSFTTASRLASSFSTASWSPRDPDEKLIKRVIAVEGDTVKASDMLRYVSIPAGHCWVEGDHTAHSMDSNYFRTGVRGVDLRQGVPHRVAPVPLAEAEQRHGEETRRLATPLTPPHHSMTNSKCYVDFE